MAVSIDQQTNKKHLVAAGNDKVYAERAVAGTLNEVTGVTVDTSDQVNMFSGLQKAFVINGANLGIVDFVNTKLTLDGALTRYPLRGQILTQANSDATMIIDYIDSSNNIIYGYSCNAGH